MYKYSFCRILLQVAGSRRARRQGTHGRRDDDGGERRRPVRRGLATSGGHCRGDRLCRTGTRAAAGPSSPGHADDGDGLAGHQHAPSPSGARADLGWRGAAPRRPGAGGRGRHHLPGAPGGRVRGSRTAAAGGGSARRRSLGCLPDPRTGGSFQVVPGHRRDARRSGLRPHRVRVEQHQDRAPAFEPGLLPDRLTARAAAARQGRPADAGRGHHRRREVGYLRRRQGARPTGRTSARTTGAWRPTARSDIATPRRWSRPWASG